MSGSSWALIGLSNHGVVNIWAPAPGATGALGVSKPWASSPTSAALTLTTGQVALGHFDGSITVYSISAGCFSPVTALSDSHDAVRALAQSGSRLVSASDGTDLCIWGIGGDWPCLGYLRGHTSRLIALCCVGAGLVASGSADGTLRVWDPVSLTQVGPPTPIGRSLQCMCPVEGGGVVCGWPHQAVRFHRDPSGSLVPIAGPRLAGGTLSLAYLSSGWLARGTTWDGAEILPVSPPAGGEGGGGAVLFSGHSEPLTSMCQAGDGSLVGAGGGKVCVWDTEGGACLQTTAHAAEVLVLWRRPTVAGLLGCLAGVEGDARPGYAAELEAAGRCMGVRRMPLVVWRRGVRRPPTKPAA